MTDQQQIDKQPPPPEDFAPLSDERREEIARRLFPPGSFVVLSPVSWNRLSRTLSAIDEMNIRLNCEEEKP